MTIRCRVSILSNSDLPQWAYDADKAAFHFRKAGLSGAKIELSASDAAFVGAVDMAQLFQASARKAGIDVQVKREPADGYWMNSYFTVDVIAIDYQFQINLSR